MTPNTESALLAELSRMGALVKKLTEEKEALKVVIANLLGVNDGDISGPHQIYGIFEEARAAVEAQ